MEYYGSNATIHMCMPMCYFLYVGTKYDNSILPHSSYICCKYIQCETVSSRMKTDIVTTRL